MYIRHSPILGERALLEAGAAARAAMQFEAAVFANLGRGQALPVGLGPVPPPLLLPRGPRLSLPGQQIPAPFGQCQPVLTWPLDSAIQYPVAVVTSCPAGGMGNVLSGHVPQVQARPHGTVSPSPRPTAGYTERRAGSISRGAQTPATPPSGMRLFTPGRGDRRQSTPSRTPGPAATSAIGAAQAINSMAAGGSVSIPLRQSGSVTVPLPKAEVSQCLPAKAVSAPTTQGAWSAGVAERVSTPARPPAPANYNMANMDQLPRFQPPRFDSQHLPVPDSPEMTPAQGNPVPQSLEGFRQGQRVEYFSNSNGGWIPCTVLRVRVDGAVELNVRAGDWIGGDEQRRKLRMLVVAAVPDDGKRRSRGEAIVQQVGAGSGAVTDRTFEHGKPSNICELFVDEEDIVTCLAAGGEKKWSWGASAVAPVNAGAATGARESGGAPALHHVLPAEPPKQEVALPPDPVVGRAATMPQGVPKFREPEFSWPLPVPESPEPTPAAANAPQAKGGFLWPKMPPVPEHAPNAAPERTAPITISAGQKRTDLPRFKPPPFDSKNLPVPESPDPTPHCHGKGFSGFSWSEAATAQHIAALSRPVF